MMVKLAILAAVAAALGVLLWLMFRDPPETGGRESDGASGVEEPHRHTHADGSAHLD